MKTKLLIPIFLALVLVISNCNPKKQGQSEEEETASIQDQSKGYRLERIWATDALLRTPESVIYDPFRNVIYVSLSIQLQTQIICF